MRLWLAFILSTFAAASAFAQAATPAKKTELQLTLDKKVQRWQTVFDDVSIAIAYIENGKVSWISIHGTRFPGGPPADGKTLYSVASLTKPITAETILRMASAGKLSLDESISPYWIDPDVKDNQWNALLTPRICLSHQTGFPNCGSVSHGFHGPSSAPSSLRTLMKPWKCPAIPSFISAASFF